MKTDKKILLAFLLNLFFSIFELIGGALTGSIAIISDAVHDFGDGLSIGLSYFFEKLSHKKPNNKYTFGYYRYSVLGGVIQSVFLLCGSFFVIYNGILRLISPIKINYDGMIIIAIIGFIVNFAAAYFTSGDGSINQKAINLHMLEDVLGWAIVLVGAIVIKFTKWYFLDALLSISLGVFITINALKTIKKVLDIFLQKTPKNIDIDEIKSHLLKIDGVKDIHHFHIWSIDGYKNFATLHVVSDGNFYQIKNSVKQELSEHKITHSTIECEYEDEICHEMCCNIHSDDHSHNHCHHHH